MTFIKQGLLLASLLFALNAVNGQEQSFPKIDIKKEKFALIKKKIEEYLDVKEKEVAKEKKKNDEADEDENTQLRRWLRDQEDHLDKNGYLFNYKAKNWEEYLRVTNFTSQAGEARPGTYTSGGDWQPYYANTISGNDKFQGRINCLAIDPNNSSVIYAGATEGGVWKSTNGGLLWSCITNHLPVNEVASIAINPNNSNNIFILVGEPYWGNNNAPGYSSANAYFVGVLVTYDGGINWYSTGLFYDHSLWVNNPSNSGIPFAAYDLVISPDNGWLLASMGDGIHVSKDNGLTWQLASNIQARDLQFAPNSNKCYAGTANDIWISNANGDVNSWQKVSSFKYYPYQPTATLVVKLAVTPADPDYVYALFKGTLSTHSYVYLSTSGGTRFDQQSEVTSAPIVNGNPGQTTYMGWQDDYNYGLAVSEIDKNRIYMGALNNYTSSDHGQSWNWILPASCGIVHSDTHDMICNGSTLYIANDGGVYRSNDGGGCDWLGTDLNVAQYRGFDNFPGDPALFVGGTQDDAIIKLSGHTLSIHASGDMGHAMFDAHDVNTFYVNGPFGSGTAYLKRTTNSGVNFTNASPSNANCNCTAPSDGINSPALGRNPRSTSNTIYVMYKDFYYSYNKGDTWKQVLTGSPEKFFTFAQGLNDTGRFYAVYNQEIWASNNGYLNGSWHHIYTHPFDSPSQNITSITVDPVDANYFYITCRGYEATNKIWRLRWNGTDPAVQSNDILNLTTPDLPNVPFFKVICQRGVKGIYVGTDIGVYFRPDVTQKWLLFSNGLPYCHVVDLNINESSQLVNCATFGRGIWQSPIYSGCTANYDAYSSNTEPRGSEYIEASNTIHSNISIFGGLGTNVVYNAGNYVSLTEGFEVVGQSTFNAYIKGCGNPNPILYPKLTGNYAGPLSKSVVKNVISTASTKDNFSLRVIPNPASGRIKVEFAISNNGYTSISLMDLKGQMIRQIIPDSFNEKGNYQSEVDISDVSNGIYLVKLECNKKTIVSKLAIVH